VARGLSSLIVVAALALFVAGARATPQASGRAVRLVLQGTVSHDRTAGHGTFVASRAFTDSGRFTVRTNSTTLRSRWRLVGKRGTIEVSESAGRWAVTSGTARYRGLRGVGTSEVSDAVSGFREVWRGTVRR
jgi:hypothetical protein